MSNKNDWTDRLPELLEGYTETEPEGLWDAVRAGIEPKKRRIAAAWWYSGGALLAAAAIVAVVLLWPVKPSADVSLVPGDVVAEVTESVVEEAPADGEAPALAIAGQDRAPSGAIASRGCNGRGPSEMGGVSQRQAEEEIAVLPAEESASTAEPETSTAVPETQPQIGHETKMEPEIHNEPETHVVPMERIKPRVRRKPTTRVQAGFTTTGFLGQVASNTTTGVGIPANPGYRLSFMPLTKASSTVGDLYSAKPSMFSRNKASTTDASHHQSAKLALTLKVNLDYHWGIETGIVSSTLKSEFNTNVGSTNTFTERTVNYVGIPLYACYNLFEWKRLSMYLNAGPMYEFTTGTDLVTRSYTGKSLTETNSDHTLYEDSKWSVNASAGLQLRVFDRSALFVQPGVSYHFKDDSALETFYTEHPASYNVTFGYRILF